MYDFVFVLLKIVIVNVIWVEVVEDINDQKVFVIGEFGIGIFCGVVLDCKDLLILILWFVEMVEMDVNLFGVVIFIFWF